jgi:hypothetical protein
MEKLANLAMEAHARLVGDDLYATSSFLLDIACSGV